MDGNRSTGGPWRGRRGGRRAHDFDSGQVFNSKVPNYSPQPIESKTVIAATKTTGAPPDARTTLKSSLESFDFGSVAKEVEFRLKETCFSNNFSIDGILLSSSYVHYCIHTGRHTHYNPAYLPLHRASPLIGSPVNRPELAPVLDKYASQLDSCQGLQVWRARGGDLSVVLTASSEHSEQLMERGKRGANYLRNTAGKELICTVNEQGALRKMGNWVEDKQLEAENARVFPTQLVELLYSATQGLPPRGGIPKGTKRNRQDEATEDNVTESFETFVGKLSSFDTSNASETAKLPLFSILSFYREQKPPSELRTRLTLEKTFHYLMQHIVRCPRSNSPAWIGSCVRIQKPLQAAAANGELSADDASSSEIQENFISYVSDKVSNVGTARILPFLMTSIRALKQEFLRQINTRHAGGIISTCSDDGNKDVGSYAQFLLDFERYGQRRLRRLLEASVRLIILLAAFYGTQNYGDAYMFINGIQGNRREVDSIVKEAAGIFDPSAELFEDEEGPVEYLSPCVEAVSGPQITKQEVFKRINDLLASLLTGSYYLDGRKRNGEMLSLLLFQTALLIPTNNEPRLENTAHFCSFLLDLAKGEVNFSSIVSELHRFPLRVAQERGEEDDYLLAMLRLIKAIRDKQFILFFTLCRDLQSRLSLTQRCLIALSFPYLRLRAVLELFTCDTASAFVSSSVVEGSISLASLTDLFFFNTTQDCLVFFTVIGLQRHVFLRRSKRPTAIYGCEDGDGSETGESVEVEELALPLADRDTGAPLTTANDIYNILESRNCDFSAASPASQNDNTRKQLLCLPVSNSFIGFQFMPVKEAVRYYILCPLIGLSVIPPRLEEALLTPRSTEDSFEENRAVDDICEALSKSPYAKTQLRSVLCYRGGNLETNIPWISPIVDAIAPPMTSLLRNYAIVEEGVEKAQDSSISDTIEKNAIVYQSAMNLRGGKTPTGSEALFGAAAAIQHQMRETYCSLEADAAFAARARKSDEDDENFSLADKGEEMSPFEGVADACLHDGYMTDDTVSTLEDFEETAEMEDFPVETLCPEIADAEAVASSGQLESSQLPLKNIDPSSSPGSADITGTEKRAVNAVLVSASEFSSNLQEKLLEAEVQLMQSTKAAQECVKITKNTVKEIEAVIENLRSGKVISYCLGVNSDIVHPGDSTSSALSCTSEKSEEVGIAVTQCTESKSGAFSYQNDAKNDEVTSPANFQSEKIEARSSVEAFNSTKFAATFSLGTLSQKEEIKSPGSCTAVLPTHLKDIPQSPVFSEVEEPSNCEEENFEEQAEEGLGSDDDNCSTGFQEQWSSDPEHFCFANGAKDDKDDEGLVEEIISQDSMNDKDDVYEIPDEEDVENETNVYVEQFEEETDEKDSCTVEEEEEDTADFEETISSAHSNSGLPLENSETNKYPLINEVFESEKNTNNSGLGAAHYTPSPIVEFASPTPKTLAAP